MWPPINYLDLLFMLSCLCYAWNSYSSNLLICNFSGFRLPEPTLKPEDLITDRHGNYGGRGRGGRGRGGGFRGGGRGGGGPGGYRPQLGFTRDSGYRTDKDPAAANRMLGYDSTIIHKYM